MNDKVRYIQGEMVKYIKAYMLVNNIDQVVLSKMAGKSQPAISKVLRGDVAISLTIHLYLLCEGEISGITESKNNIIKSHLESESSR